MKIVVIIVRILLGLVFLVFGLNIFLQFIPAPPPPAGPAGDFFKALFVSHYLWAVGAFQVIGGAILLIGRFVPLGLLILGPIIVNILLYHFLLNSTGLPIALVVAILALFLLWYHRAAFAGFVKP
ncbi:MAG TPA: DoxX family membrane protein [Verrucomicrobiae bacterium]|jgi:uncharacterized membrane protein YphA (DoxX/SURF4 family)